MNTSAIVTTYTHSLDKAKLIVTQTVLRVFVNFRKFRTTFEQYLAAAFQSIFY